MLVQPIPYPSGGGGGGGGGTASYISGEDTAGGTFTTASVDAVSIGGSTLKANTDYLLFASVEAKSSATASSPALQVLNGSTALYDQNPRFQEISTANDGPRSLFFVRKVTTAADPTGDTWILRLAQTGSGATITWQNARLVLVEVGTNDEYAESRARQSFNPADTSQTVCTLTFTPPSAGNYLILGFMVCDRSANGTTGFNAELTDGTNTTGEITLCLPQSSERIPVCLPLEMSFSGSKTFSLKLRSPGSTGALSAADCCIVAIRTSRFANSYGAARVASVSSSLANSYQAGAWMAFTPNADDHLVLAIGAFTSSGAAVGNVEFDDGGSIIAAPQFRENTSNQNSPFLSARIASYAATQREQKILHKSTSATNEALFFPTLYTFDLGSGSGTAAGSVAVRGSNIASSSGNPLSLNLPAAAAAGDLMVLFTGGGWQPSGDPTGWTRLDYAAGSNWNGATWLKILDSADITAGSVSISYAGSFNAVRACIVFQGVPRVLRALPSLRDGAGAASRALTTDFTPRSGDYLVGFGSARVAAAVSCDQGTQLQVVNAANASGVLNGGALGADGAVTATFSYGGSPSGDYQVLPIFGT